jgi:multiple sugar transport system substrate-binding protein
MQMPFGDVPAARGGISRRDLLRGVGALAVGTAATSALSGCGTPLATGLVGSQEAANNLTFWNLFSGGDGDRMVDMEKGYEKSHRDISLSAVTLAWGNPYYTKLSLATRGGKPPDVAVSHLTRMVTLAEAGLLAPIDESLLAKAGMPAKMFNEKAWKASHVNGQLYAVPLDTHPYVLYYNTDVCKKAGLLEPDGSLKPMQGADDFIAALKAAQKVTGKYGLVASTINDTSSCWRMFASMYWQQGGSVISDQGQKVLLDDDLAMNALNLLKKLAIDESLMPQVSDDNGTVVTFSGGQAGFLWDGEWDNTVFTTNKTPYNMTRFPQLFGTDYTCQADSHVFVLPTDGGRDSARMDRCLTFLRSMLGQSYTWAEGGHIPAWLPTRDSKAYKSLAPQSNYADVADFIHYDDPAWYSGSGSDFEIFMGSAVSAVLTGTSSPKSAIAQMRTNLDRYASTPSPVA